MKGLQQAVELLYRLYPKTAPRLNSKKTKIKLSNLLYDLDDLLALASLADIRNARTGARNAIKIRNEEKKKAEHHDRIP